MGGADDRPRDFHVLDPRWQDLSEACCVLDLPEPQLDDLLCHSALEFGRHRVGDLFRLTGSEMLATPDGDIGTDLALQLHTLFRSRMLGVKLLK